LKSQRIWPVENIGKNEYLYGMKIPFVMIAVLGISVFGSCSEEISKLFEESPNKAIVITDQDLSYATKIRDINSKVIFLALVELRPSFTNINMSDLMNSIYSIGRIKNNKIELKLYSGSAAYWTGTGNYWILFILPDGRAEHISHIYLSKEPHDFYDEDTYLINTDFMPPVAIDLDISGVLPF
jgi:hypothetical protein